jgi:hypothetical protein
VPRATTWTARLDVISVVLVVACSPVLAGHDKSDVATTDDGSTYIGEIKSVQYATLNLNTDPAGLLSIEWRHVTGLTSKFEYRIELSGGIRHYGTLGPSEQPGHLSITADSGAVEVDLSDVVSIVPIEHGFWKGLDGSVNFGLTYTQANDSLQYSLSGDAERRTRRNYSSLSGQSILNTQEAGDTVSQHYLKLILAQVVKNKWGAFELAQLQSNPDQGYDMRYIAGGGASNFLIESSTKLLSLNLGAVYNREDVTDSSDVDQSAEALIAVAFRRFKRGSHSPSVQLSLMTFTNMTDTPRFRAVFNFNVGWKIVGDFKFNFQVNNSYDSDPPGTDAKNNDLTLVTSIGYTF